MLRTVRIENFLLIRDTEIEFSEGLNVISGETGTGKSMTLSAIGFVMGRQGDYPDGTAVEIELVSGDEEHILRREVRGGRNRYFINGRGTTAKTVRKILEERISLQGQNEFIKVLREDYQRDLIDRFGGIEDLRRKVEEVYRDLTSRKNTLQKILSRREEVLQRRDYLEYRIREIEEVGLSPEEVQDLRERAEVLKHRERINRLLREAVRNLYDAEGSAFDRVSEALKVLFRAEEVAGDLGGVIDTLSGVKDTLGEVVEILRDRIEEVSPEEVDRVNEILFRIQRIERKYGKPYGEIFRETEDLRRELRDLQDLDLRVEDLEEEVRDLEKRLSDLCDLLSEERKRTAGRMERSVRDILKDLNLDRAVLKVKLERTRPGRTGSDRVIFLFSAHGEDPKPLNEVASGGELTRLFLALSLILPPAETYIFDEVDAGISGETSLRLARMLRKVSRNMQVIAITHSAPVCAAGDVNFLTEKKFIGDIPYIEVRKLTPEEKVREVARLMGATTETTIRGAEELIHMVSG
ncbi:MAG: AAA family ATPase [Aquificota bacterium]|nr:AAA family ATPase [Aquificota bacterium]